MTTLEQIALVSVSCAVLIGAAFLWQRYDLAIRKRSARINWQLMNTSRGMHY